MPMNWGQIQTAALQRMFRATINGEVNSALSKQDYILAMPQAANEALRDLAGVCKPRLLTYLISQVHVENMLGETPRQFAIVRSITTDTIYTARDPQAVYFEVDGPASIVLEQVQADGSALPIQTWENTVRGQFTAYRYLILDGGDIQLRFIANYPYNIRNVAFYAQPFALQEDIPAFTRFNSYDLSALAPSFMKLEPNSVFLVDEYGRRTYNSYQWIEPSTLLLDRYFTGQLEVQYCAYPTEITASTASTFVPEIDARALDLVPLYIAGRLYGEAGVDDPRKANEYMAEYWQRRLELSEDSKPKGSDEWVCESGWV